MRKTSGSKKANHFYSHKEIKNQPKIILDAKERLNIKEYNKEINEAEEEFERGEFITNGEMKKIVKEWN